MSHIRSGTTNTRPEQPVHAHLFPVRLATHRRPARAAIRPHPPRRRRRPSLRAPAAGAPWGPPAGAHARSAQAGPDSDLGSGGDGPHRPERGSDPESWPGSPRRSTRPTSSSSRSISALIVWQADEFYFQGDWAMIGNIMTEFTGQKIIPPMSALANPRYDTAISILDGTLIPGLGPRVRPTWYKQRFRGRDRPSTFRTPATTQRRRSSFPPSNIATAYLLAGILGVPETAITASDEIQTPTIIATNTPTEYGGGCYAGWHADDHGRQARRGAALPDGGAGIRLSQRATGRARSSSSLATTCPIPPGTTSTRTRRRCGDLRTAVVVTRLRVRSPATMGLGLFRGEEEEAANDELDPATVELLLRHLGRERCRSAAPHRLQHPRELGTERRPPARTASRSAP